jgi:hypothetical protein
MASRSNSRSLLRAVLRKSTLLAVIGLLAGPATGAAGSGLPTQQAELTPGDGMGFDFGTSVAISGSTSSWALRARRHSPEQPTST